MVYYFFLVLKYAAYLAVALLALFLLVKMFKCRKYLKLSNIAEASSAYMSNVVKTFFKCAAVLSAFLLVGMMLASVQNSLHGQATISLNYKDASKGLNPDGSRYNMSEILSDDVLERAIEIGAFENVSVSALKQSLSLVPSVQGTTDNEYNYRVSTEFKLSYNATQALADLNADTVLQVVMQAYKEWYYDTYVDKFSLLALDFEDINDFDYLEICDYLDKKAQNISFYIKAYEQKDATFRQEGNENTFSTLSTSCWQFRDVALENLRSYIMENGLSKDLNSYTGKLNYESKLAQFDYSKAYQSHAIRLEAIQMYENDMARIVLVPSYDKAEEFYMSRTKIGIDDFSRDAEKFANEMNTLDYLVSKNNMILTKLAETQATTYNYAQADQMIEDMKTQLTQLSGSLMQLVGASQGKEMNEGFTLVTEPSVAAYWTYVTKMVLFGALLLVARGMMTVLRQINNKVAMEQREGAEL